MTKKTIKNNIDKIFILVLSLILFGVALFILLTNIKSFNEYYNLKALYLNYQNNSDLFTPSDTESFLNYNAKSLRDFIDSWNAKVLDKKYESTFLDTIKQYKDAYEKLIKDKDYIESLEGVDKRMYLFKVNEYKHVINLKYSYADLTQMYWGISIIVMVLVMWVYLSFFLVNSLKKKQKKEIKKTNSKAKKKEKK